MPLREPYVLTKSYGTRGEVINPNKTPLRKLKVKVLLDTSILILAS